MNHPKQPKKGTYAVDATLLLSPLLPEGKELHLPLLQWVSVGRALRLLSTVWEETCFSSECSSERCFIQKRTWYYSKLEKMWMPQSLKASVFLFCRHQKKNTLVTKTEICKQKFLGFTRDPRIICAINWYFISSYSLSSCTFGCLI